MQFMKLFYMAVAILILNGENKGGIKMKLKEAFKIQDFLEFEIVKNIYAFIYKENNIYYIEVYSNKDYTNKINVEDFIHLTDDSLLEDLRDTIARGIVRKFLIEKV